MKIDLLRADPTIALRLLGDAMLRVPLVCIEKVTSPSVVNQTFVVSHTLKQRPAFFAAFPWSGAGVAGATEDEQRRWDASTISIHSSTASTTYTVIVVSLT